MSNALTYDDILKLFQQTEALIKENSLASARRNQETDRKFQETDRKFQETDRKFQETDRKFQESDRKFREMSQETDRMFREMSQESDRKFREMSQESDRMFQETVRETARGIEKVDQQIEKVNQQIGAMTGKWGLFVENLVAPACSTIFAERGIPVDQISQRVKSTKQDRAMEIDILVVNGLDLVAVEVKTTLGVDDVRAFCQNLEEFRMFYPQYGDFRVHGAMAAMVAPTNTLAFARRNGLFVIIPSGNTVCIDNPASFQPKAW